MSTRFGHVLLVLVNLGIFGCGGEYEGVQPASQSIQRSSRADADAIPSQASGKNSDDPFDANDLKDEDKTFTKLVQPLLNEHCGSCHSASQTPFFAVSDPDAALESLRESRKLDELHPEQSRIFLRLINDKHQCWSDCEVDAKNLLDRINTWLDATKKTAEGDSQAKLQTKSLRIGDARTEEREPDSPGTLIFEAESGMLTAPMVLIQTGDVSGGSAIETPELNGAALAANAANAGRVTYQFEIETAGTYFIFAKVQGPSNNANAFNYRIDSQAFAVWNFAMTGNEWRWIRLAGANNQPASFNLASGAHSLEIRQREDGAKIDLVAITNDAMFTEGAPNQNLKAQVLDFDLSEMIGKPAKLSIDVADFDQFSLKFRNPKILIEQAQVKIKGLHILINGKEVPEAATYSLVDTTVSAPGALLSGASMIVPKQSMDDLNDISFRFDLAE